MMGSWERSHCKLCRIKHLLLMDWRCPLLPKRDSACWRKWSRLHLQLLLPKLKVKPGKTLKIKNFETGYFFFFPCVFGSALADDQWQHFLTLSWHQIWQSNPKQAPNVVALVERFNNTSLWVADCILERQNADERAFLIDLFINIAQVCFFHFLSL